jgi:preprotein translocase subunit SecD
VRRNVVYLVGTVVVTILALAATILRGDSPVLGLDLQGGISVVLAPTGEANSESLDVAVDIIRSRVDSLGVAEPEISRSGDNVVIDLPGVKDRDKARRLVGRTAEVRFRPVLALVPPRGSAEPSTSTTTTTPATTAPGATETTPTTAAPTSTTTPITDEAAALAIASCDPTQINALIEQGVEIPNTRLANDKRNDCVVLPPRKTDPNRARFLLGPAALTGRDTGGADSLFNGGQYVVDLSLEASGREKMNALAAEAFPKPAPQNQMAIVLDGVVQSAPAFQEPNFPGDVQISGSFSSTEASDLAKLLQYGALPVQLKELTTENVSPTLGNDQLTAGIAAGLIGIGLVAIYMLAYYRLLGMVVILGLAVTAGLTYALISYLGQSIGLALTLAGVTGLIVSVGVTVDSYVVYFERLKDEVKAGRTVRSSVDRGFAKSFRTILAADLVSLIGAAVLYALAVGSVRGFAFFLGLATLLDLGVSYFFMHPLVVLLARRPQLLRARYVGIAYGLDAKEATT